MTELNPALVTAAFGVGAHFTYHHWEPPTISGHTALLFGIPSALGWFFFRQGVYAHLAASILITVAIYLTALATSIVAYRLSPFHPLAKYPGPVLAKATRLWALYQAIGGKHHLYYSRLHERYGDVVRTGPNHLFIKDVTAIPVVLGPGPANERWPRSRRYEVTKYSGTPGGIISIIPPALHAQRRRVWDRAFTSIAIKDYEPMIERRATQLIEQLQKRKGQEINLGHWLGCFTLDFMGDLAFASAFNSLEKGGDGGDIQKILESAPRVQDLLGTLPWIRTLWVMLPRPASVQKTYNLGAHMVAQRRAKPAMRKDIFFHLLDEDGSSGHEPLSDASLTMDASIALVAGTDSTAVALSNIFYYLLANPPVLTRLLEELDSKLPPGVEYPDMMLLGQLPFLNAVINETLRLQPATPTGLQRSIPVDSQGVAIGQIAIPPDTTVQVPTWALHRDPRYFWPHPNSFYPDRWLVDPKTTNSDNFRLNMMAYTPFSYGPQNCVGKQLALNEMRLVVSSLIRIFDIKFAPGWDLRKWEENLRSYYILERGPFPVVLTPRKRV